MVLTAFRGADPTAVSPLARVQRSDAVAHIQNDAPALSYALIGSPGFSEDVATVGPSFAQEAEQSRFDESDEMRFEFFDDKDPEDRPLATQPDSFVFAELGLSQNGGELSGGFLQSIVSSEPEADQNHFEADEFHLAGQRSGYTGSTLDSAAVSLVEDLSEEPRLIAEGSAPLPAWDYSHSEWPVLVGPNKQKSPRRRRVWIAATVLAACAAGLYFVVNPFSTSERRASGSTAPERRPAIAEPRVAGATPEDLNAGDRAPSTPADTPAAAAAKPAETDARLMAVSGENNNSQGRFSLQAAAFPTQSDADQFAEKLKRAGVPSYVAEADLARRGKWFRVRVGRFNAAEEAQKFVGEAQQRARAAGLALQLIVCQYDQP